MRSPTVSAIALLTALGFLAPTASADSGTHHRWFVKDQSGMPLGGAVVTLKDGITPVLPLTTVAVVAQKGKQFTPSTLIVPVGSRVSFPNLDDTAHHVYSFSEAKPFELELYKGDSHPPLLFDQVGAVVLGCNIHDAMRGVIFVTDAPSYGASDADGLVQLPVITGKDQQTIALWHPRQLEPADPIIWSRAKGVPDLTIEVSAPPKPVTRGLGAWRVRQTGKKQ